MSQNQAPCSSLRGPLVVCGPVAAGLDMTGHDFTTISVFFFRTSASVDQL